MDRWRRYKEWSNSPNRNWSRAAVHWAAVSVLVALLGIVVAVAFTQLPSGRHEAAPAPKISTTNSFETPGQTPSETTGSAEPTSSYSPSPITPTAPIQHETQQGPAVAPRVPEVRSASTPLVLDLDFDDVGQVGPSIWKLTCCKFAIGTRLSDKFGEISGRSDCWITIGLIKKGVLEREVQGVCGPGWASIYEGLSEGNYVLRFHAATRWGQELVVDKPVTILPKA